MAGVKQIVYEDEFVVYTSGCEGKRKKNYRSHAKERRYLYKSTQHCKYCNKYLKYKECTVDHVIPRSKKGKSSFDNLVLACNECNQMKGDMDLDEFLKLLETKKSNLDVSQEQLAMMLPPIAQHPTEEN